MDDITVEEIDELISELWVADVLLSVADFCSCSSSLVISSDTDLSSS